MPAPMTVRFILGEEQFSGETGEQFGGSQREFVSRNS